MVLVLIDTGGCGLGAALTWDAATRDGAAGAMGACRQQLPKKGGESAGVAASAVGAGGLALDGLA